MRGDLLEIVPGQKAGPDRRDDDDTHRGIAGCARLERFEERRHHRRGKALRLGADR